jgi:hypothetical protein
MGHKCLLLQSGKVKVFRTVEVHETIFPFLLELQKSVPYALQFAPKTQQLQQPLEFFELEHDSPDKGPDLLVEEVSDDIKPMESLILKLDTTVPVDVPTPIIPITPNPTQPAMVQDLALPDLNAKAVKLPARKQRVNYKELSQGDKKPIKVKVPARFKIGDTIMTKEGAVLVHSMGKKGIIQVTRPNHHSVPP